MEKVKVGQLLNLPCLQCGEALFDHNPDEVRHCLYRLAEMANEREEEKEIESDFRTFMNGGTCERCDRRTLIYPDIKMCRRCYTELEAPERIALAEERYKIALEKQEARERGWQI